MTKSFKKITLGSEIINYTLFKSSKAKGVKLSVKPGGSLLVTIPVFASQKTAEDFMHKKERWILYNLTKLKDLPENQLKGDEKEFIKSKPLAKQIVRKKIEQFNTHYNFKYSKITIKNSKTRWGSCSSGGNLTFHYRIIFLSEALADYLIVHELCHLKEMNHSSAFWDLVGEQIPNYKRLRKKLRNLQ